MQPTQHEQWRPIPGYEGHYSASDQGRVRSEARRVTKRNGHPHSVRERVLKPWEWRGYLRVGIKLPTEPCYITTVHILVMAAFIGPRPPGMLHVCHNNGDGLDNRLVNLRYDTVAGNSADKAAHGTRTFGETHSRAKLTNEDVLKIRELGARRGLAQVEIGALFGVSRETVNRIVRRRDWSHLV